MPPGMELRIPQSKGQVVHDIAHPKVNIPIRVRRQSRRCSDAPQPLDRLIRQTGIDLCDMRGDHEHDKDKRRLEDNELQQMVLRPGIEHDDSSQKSIESQPDRKPSSIAPVGFVLGATVDDDEDTVDHGDFIEHLEGEEEGPMEGDGTDADDDDGSKGEKEAFLEG